MDLGIAGKVALVTGGSRGLGYHSAAALAREGAKVAVCARGKERLEQAVGSLKASGGEVMGVQADVTDANTARDIVDKVAAQFGPVDILVNNVGGSRGADALSTTEEQWKEAFDLNVLAALRLARLVVPGMKERGWGRIVNIASIYGREHGGRATYMAAKAALIATTKHMGLDLAQTGITVNSIAPGSIAFPGGGWDRFQREQPPEVVREFIERNLPMKRFGWPEPVADTVAFLASARADLITGACFNVDGGQSHSLI